jgi:hypothetical protein
MLVPLMVTSPLVNTLFFGNRRMIERAVTLFPDPLSPTTPNDLPRASENEMLSTAFNRPLGLANSVVRFLTSRMTAPSFTGTALLTLAPVTLALLPPVRGEEVIERFRRSGESGRQRSVPRRSRASSALQRHNVPGRGGTEYESGSRWGDESATVGRRRPRRPEVR